MKKSTFYSIFVLVGLVCILMLAQKGQAGFNKDIYGFKNAEIITESKISMGKIIQKFSIGEGGKYVKEESTTEINVFGIKRKETQINYTDHVKGMVYNLNQDTGEYSAVDISEMMDEVKKNNMKEFNKENLEKFGGKIIRKEKYKDLDVVVVEYADFQTIVKYHKRYPVSMVSNAAGIEMKTELVFFKEGVAKDYKLPKNAKVGKAQSISDIMGQVNAYKNNPEYQESKKANKAERDYVTAEDLQKYQNQSNSGYDPKNMPDIQKAMKDAGPEVQDAMKAVLEMFGNN